MLCKITLYVYSIETLLCYSLEYDTTLCKAAFLPELSIERRVDVPKKFILPDGDIDSTNNKNLDVFDDEDSVEKIGKEEDNDEDQVRTHNIDITLL